MHLTLKDRLWFIVWCCRWRGSRIMMMVLVRALCHQQEDWLGLHQQSVSLTDGNTWSSLTALLTARSQEVPILNLFFFLFWCFYAIICNLFLPARASSRDQLPLLNLTTDHCAGLQSRHRRKSGTLTALHWVIVNCHLSRLCFFGDSFFQESINFQLFFPQSIYLEVSSLCMLMNGQQT